MGAGVAAVLVALVLHLAVTGVPAAAFDERSQERDEALPGCGICYPGGFDLNTVGNVRGTVLSLEQRAEGPVRFTVAGPEERWIVLASPAWHWRTAGFRLNAGDSVTVRGSKTLGSDGSLYLIAQEIRRDDAQAALVLRDGRGRPLWSGGHGVSSGAGGGAGGGRGCSNGARRP